MQKASFGKRIIAAICDGILVSILAVGLAALLSVILKYDGYISRVDNAYAKYEAEYGIEFKITQEEYENLTEEKREAYDTAYEALTTDKDVLYDYNMLINLTLLILTFSVLIGVIAVEFVVPLLFGNGQTIGKKVFGIALMHQEGIKINNIQLFARTVLGKFAIELMIPLYIIMMIFFNSIGIISIILMLVLFIAQIICFFASRTNSPIHDLLAGTVAVDMASQKIFADREALLEYIKAKHKDIAAN